jgi:hypothetical protein
MIALILLIVWLLLIMNIYFFSDFQQLFPQRCFRYNC